MSAESPLNQARKAREARTDLLRRARETAPAVLPRGISEAVVMALGDAFYDQRAYQDRLAAEVLALAEQPSPILELSSIELTPEQVEELKARFEATRHQPPKVIGPVKPSVTRAQVRAAASALFQWNHEVATDHRFSLHHVTGGVDREPYGALVDEVLHHLGIRVQEGT